MMFPASNWTFWWPWPWRGMKLQEALELTAKVLVKTMDTASPTAERLEFGIVPGKEGVEKDGEIGWNWTFILIFCMML